MLTRFALPLLLAAVSTVAMGMACGDDNDANDEAIRGAVTSLVEKYNAGDAEGFFAAMTDEAVRDFLEFQGMPVDDLEAAKEQAAPFIGEPPLEVRTIDIKESDDESATVELLSESGGVLEGDLIELVADGESWKVSLIRPFAVSPEVPDGYETIDLVLNEFSFGLEDDVPAGNIAFALENQGEQPHEAVLLRLDEDVDLQEALQSDEEPEGLEFLGGVFNVEAGDEYNLVFMQALDAGRYALVCFLPDTDEGPQGTPHAFKGMVTEFQIQ